MKWKSYQPNITKDLKRERKSLKTEKCSSEDEVYPLLDFITSVTFIYWLLKTRGSIDMRNVTTERVTIAVAVLKTRHNLMPSQILNQVVVVPRFPR